jgi:four helix bundle protein
MKQVLFDDNLVLKKSFDFALLTINYCEVLQERKFFILANQLFKSGTSIGANVAEAQNSESKADFIHKLKIAAKEADETQYWLLLCNYAKNYPDCKELLQQLEHIQKLLSKILSTLKRKNPFSYLLCLFIF